MTKWVSYTRQSCCVAVDFVLGAFQPPNVYMQTVEKFYPIDSEINGLKMFANRARANNNSNIIFAVNPYQIRHEFIGLR